MLFGRYASSTQTCVNSLRMNTCNCKYQMIFSTDDKIFCSRLVGLNPSTAWQMYPMRRTLPRKDMFEILNFNAISMSLCIVNMHVMVLIHISSGRRTWWCQEHSKGPSIRGSTDCSWPWPRSFDDFIGAVDGSLNSSNSFKKGQTLGCVFAFVGITKSSC